MCSLLYQMVTYSRCPWVSHKPLPPQFLHFMLHIFVVGEHRDFKFGVAVDHSMSQPALKGTWSRHVTHFKFLVPLKYLWIGLS